MNPSSLMQTQGIQFPTRDLDPLVAMTLIYSLPIWNTTFCQVLCQYLYHWYTIPIYCLWLNLNSWMLHEVGFFFFWGGIFSLRSNAGWYVWSSVMLINYLFPREKPLFLIRKQLALRLANSSSGGLLKPAELSYSSQNSQTESRHPQEVWKRFWRKPGFYGMVSIQIDPCYLRQP